MPGPGNPNNQGNGPKNQLNLANGDLAGYVAGVFTDLDSLELKTFKNKVVIGTDGDDHLALGDGNDQMWAGAGDDTILGGDGNDVIRGEAGNDLLSGEVGNDVLDGGEGIDTLNGGAGDDVIEGGAGADILDGGADNDTVSYESSDAGVTVDLSTDTATGGHADGDTLAAGSFENIIGSAHADTLTGDENDNVIDGGAGADVINGGDGADTLSGGAGGDTDLFDLGLTSGVDDDPSSLTRDNFQDTVVAQADFAANGTDNIVHYSDGQDDETTGFAFDLIDFTALLGDGGDPNNVLFVVQDGTDTQIWEDATDDDTIDVTNDNQWFSISEDSSVGNNPAEIVFIQVGDDVYKWDAGGQDWDMLV